MTEAQQNDGTEVLVIPPQDVLDAAMAESTAAVMERTRLKVLGRIGIVTLQNQLSRL